MKLVTIALADPQRDVIIKLQEISAMHGFRFYEAERDYLFLAMTVEDDPLWVHQVNGMLEAAVIYAKLKGYKMTVNKVMTKGTTYKMGVKC